MTPADGELMLHLERVVAVPRARVFDACLDPDQLPHWWGPAGFTTPEIALDAREGGRYRFLMQPPSGDAFHLRGAFAEIDPPRRLVFTFEWEEPDPDDQETTVTLSFHDHREGATVVLDQGPFATEARRELHENGWTESFDRLEQFLA